MQNIYTYNFNQNQNNFNQSYIKTITRNSYVLIYTIYLPAFRQAHCTRLSAFFTALMRINCGQYCL